MGCLYVNSKMEDEIVNKLGLKVFKLIQNSAGGCISSGSVYKTDIGKVFVKKNSKDGADTMFNGEFAGLKALRSAQFPVPNPLLVGNNYLVTEFVNIISLNKCAAELGTQLAMLHQAAAPTEKFGFECDTCCGFLPMDNTWRSDWPEFYTKQRLQPLVERLHAEKQDKELSQLWNKLQIIIPSLFENIKVIPALLHGDLWSGNAGDTTNGPIAFDPAAFYGHAEFDLAIARMFGGFPRAFFDAYHALVPQQPGFRRRQDLYLLFHNLNHWAHFGAGYRESSLTLMRGLLNGS